MPFSVRATVSFEGKSKPFAYDSRLTVVRGETTGKALVDWKPSVLHPEMQEMSPERVHEVGQRRLRAYPPLQLRVLPDVGRHEACGRNQDQVLGGGNLIKIPPDPDVYPSDIEIPRDAIPHIEEHAGVFVGYHCADGDDACQKMVNDLTDVINDRIDNHKNRVVMANDSDLPEGTIGMASWNRVEDFDYKDYTRDRVVTFVGTNSCRVDFEGFCK